MGKRLVILGADFSENCIVYPNNELYAEMSAALNIGYGFTYSGGGVVVVANTKRASIYGVDLSKYYELGCRTIKVNLSPSYNIAFCIGDSASSVKVYDKDGNETTWNWYNDSSLQGPIGANSKLFINIKNAGGTDIATSVTLSDIITSVELS